MKKPKIRQNELSVRIKIGSRWGMWVILALMLFLAVVTLWPILWLLASSLKTGAELTANPWGFPKEPVLANYYNAWVRSRLGVNILNSILTTVVCVAATIVCSSTIAYVVSRLQFKGRSAVFYFVIAGMMVPVHSLVIPIYLNTLDLGLQNDLFVLGLIYAAFRIPFSVFILEGFMVGIPRELEECATVDGCSVWGCFLKIIFPLTRDGLITVGILAAMSAWNELLVASLLLKRPELKTLTIGLRAFVTEQQLEMPQLFAGLFIACLPCLIAYGLASDKMIKGMTMGAVKG